MRGRFNKSGGSAVSFFAFQDVITGTTGFLIIITIFLALNLDEVISVSSDDDPNEKLALSLQETVEKIARLKGGVAAPSLVSNETKETLTRMIEELKRSIERLAPPSDSKGPPPTADESPLAREIRIEKQKLLTLIDEFKKSLPDATKEAAESESKLAALESEVKEVESRLLKSYDQKNVLRLIPQKSSTNKDPVLVVIEKAGFQILLFDGSKTRSASSENSLMQTLSDFSPASHYVVLYFKPSGSMQFDDVKKRVRSAGYEIGYDLIPENIQLETTAVKE